MVSRRAVSGGRKMLIAVIVVALALGLGTALVVMSSPNGTVTSTASSGTSTSTATGSSGFNCNDPGAPYGVPANAGLPLIVGNNLYQCERVLVIPPGSTGVLVVSYQTDLNAVSPPSEGGSEIANFTSDILVPDWSQAVSIPERYSYVNATGVSITPSMRSVNVTALGNATSFTVAYTIKVSSDVSGFFELQYLDACPTMIPLAVGYSVSQLNASSFPDYQPFLQGCFGLAMLSGGTLMSVSGIQTAWLVQTIQQSSNTTMSTTTTSSSISTATSIATTNATSKDIGNISVNGTSNINGTNLFGTLDVTYPNSAQSGNLSAPIVGASITIDCNDSFFTINADNRVIVNLTIVGNGNTVNMNDLRLNVTINGNLNTVGVMPEPVMLYGVHIDGTGNMIFISPLPP